MATGTKPGDSVERDEVLVEIETDKVVLEVPASDSGVLEAVLEEEGQPSSPDNCSDASVWATAPVCLRK